MLKKRISSLFFHIITLSICLLQQACNLSSTNVGNTANTLAIKIQNTVSLGSIATIPRLANSYPITSVVVNNNVGTNLKLISANILQGNKIINVINTNDLVDVNSCNNLAANAVCPVAISPTDLSGSFILKLIFADEKGATYPSVQIINYSSQVKQENGFVYFTPDTLPLDYGTHTLSVPVILENNYSKLNATTQDFPGSHTHIQCPDGKYISGTMCTIYVSYSVVNNPEKLSPKLLISGEIVSQNNNVQSKAVSYNSVVLPLSLSNNSAANLVVSAPNIQVTAGSNTSVTMLNNGMAVATNISYNGITPIIATTSGGTCGSTLAAGSTCTFNVSVGSATVSSGSGKVVVLYSNGAGALESTPFNVYYFPASTIPGLALYTNGWLVDTLVSSVNYQGVYVVNSGTATLNNLQFSNVNNQVSGMSYGGNGQTCVSAQSLAPGNSCVLVVSYAPATAVSFSTSNKVNISPTAMYTDSGGNQLTYIGSSLSMQYSANAPGANLGNYIVAGDYGSITANLGAAVITGTTGWSVKNNTPFTATGVTISRMVNNGTLQVVGTGGTAAGFIYQAPNGMIWEGANAGGVPPSGAAANAITGITYDGTNGYLVTNNANTNLYSTSSLNKSSTAWSTLAAFNASSAFNLFNFFDGSSWSYFAPQNTATNNRQLAVSKTPATAAWTSVNPTGTARAYVSVIYDGARYCTLSSTKFVACANSAGFTTGSTWTQNTTAISSSTASTMFTNNGSNSYVALNTTAPLVVYLTSPSNPASAGTWTSATTQPSAALAWVDYAAGQYVAVTGSATSPGQIWTSPNGNIWTQRTLGTASNPANEPYGFIYYDGSNYWASGTTVLRVSPDGINWDNAGIQSLTFLYNGNTLTYLAAGTAGAIESSTNLTTWSGVNSTVSTKLNRIACFNSNNCFAVGESGTILSSNDGAGTVWNSESSTTTNGLNSVACGYTNCVVVGDNGIVLTQSITATTWSSQIIDSNNLNSVTFSTIYNRYIAVGDAGIIYTSSDGINWVNENSNTAYNLTSVKCAASVVGCMAVGNVIATPTSGTILTSANGLSWTAQPNTTGSNIDVGFYNGNWVVAQGTSTVGGTIRSTPDVFPLVWTSAKTSGVSVTSVMNFNAILAY